MEAMRRFVFLAVALGCQRAPTVPSTLPADSSVTQDDTPEVQGVDAPPVDTPTVDAPPVDAPPVDTAPPPAPLRVLFVGNSYTYVNDLPALVARLATEGARQGNGPTIAVDSVTVGGATLGDHWTQDNAPTRVRAGGWSAVVLQGQSVEPALNAASFRTYAVRFGELAASVRARPVFFATWPRRAGDVVYAQPWSGGTPEAFNARLDEGYSAAATAVGGVTAHVGNAWMAALRAHPSVNLYDPDGSHPSPAGTWLAGCVMYRALTGLDAPAGLDGAVAGVTADDARALRETARSL